MLLLVRLATEQIIYYLGVQGLSLDRVFEFVAHKAINFFIFVKTRLTVTV